MNIVNLITITRILTLPFIIYFVNQNNFVYAILATIFYFLATIGDFLDTFIAKKKNIHTKVGSFLDPLASRIIAWGLLFFFALHNHLLFIPLVIIIITDIITIILSAKAAHDNIKLPRPLRRLQKGTHYLLIFLILLRVVFILKSEWSHLISITEYSIMSIIIFTIIVDVSSPIYSLRKYWNKIKDKKETGKKVEKVPFVILANKRSRGFKEWYRRRLLLKFARRSKAKIIYLPKNSKNMFEHVKDKIDKFNHIIIAGGDGSFESALNQKMFHDKSLGFFPLGGGNAFYSYFYKGKKFAYLRERFNFKEEELDIVEIQWDGKKQLTTFLGVGTDSEVARLTKSRTQNSFRDYLQGAYKAILKGKSEFNLTVKVDDKEHYWKNTVNITLGKVPYYGYGVHSLLRPVKDDNNQVYGLACVNTHSIYINKLIRTWALLLTNLNFNRSPLIKFKGEKITIESEKEFPLQAGGDFIGLTKKIQLKVVRKQKILVI